MGDERPPFLWILYPVLKPLNEIDAALGFAFLDIEVAFEIVVLCLFRDFSKHAQLNGNMALESPIGTAWTSKTNIGACEIDPGKIG